MQIRFIDIEYKWAAASVPISRQMSSLYAGLFLET